MALTPLKLDDLSWKEMVESVRRRIPGASNGAWTHHASVDPGMTFLELFAWLIEQRLYWIDQSSPAMRRALFAMLGESPRGAQTAATVLACRGTPGLFHELPAGIEFTFTSADATRVFTARQDVMVAPVKRLGVRTAQGDRTADLDAGKPIPLLPDDGTPAGFSVDLWLSHGGPLPATPSKLSVLFQVDGFDRIEPEWSREAASAVRPAASLAWSFSTGPGTWRDFAAGEVEDGTAGLRRSGVIRFALAQGWLPRAVGPGGESAFAVRVRTPAATFTVPPHLLALSANVVIADHWKAVTVPVDDLGRQARQWPKLPGQELRLAPDEPLPIEGTVGLDLQERDRVHAWKPANDFGFADRSTRTFVVDRTARTLRFGDGITGRIPVPDEQRTPPVLRVTYRGGGGVDGNVAAGKRWHTQVGALAIEAVNPVPASGGADPETLDEASARIGGALKLQERAITAPDHEALALSTPGIAMARALAVVGLHPLFPCSKTPGAITVFVVPFAPRPGQFDWRWPDPSLVAAPAIDPGALAAVQLRLDRARLVASQVFARPVEYRPVSLRVVISPTPADVDAVRERIGARLSRYLDPLAGGEGKVGLPFGEPVRPSALVRIAQDAIGREGIVEQVAVGLDRDAPAENCRDVPIGPYQLSYLRSITVAFEKQSASGALP